MLKYDSATRSFVPGELPADGAKITALYARLSQEDGSEGDSGSIANQREFLYKYATEQGFTNPRLFCDDGYTGTNFNRPGYQEMMEYVEQGRVATVIVKDHSRLGRNRLVVGALMEKFTDEYSTRYIAVTDNIDSDKGFDEMVGIREWFNEFYPRDTSKKIRAVVMSKGNSGQRLCTQVPYGYVGNKYTWEIDPPAAEVVREIFRLCIEGLGPMQISNRLTAERRLTPTAYILGMGRNSCHPAPVDPYRWSPTTTANILGCQEYTGCTVNFKTRKVSYKSRKSVELPPEEHKVFHDTHPAIIDEETFARVQELRQNKRRPTKTGRHNIFSGLLFCADCGAKMHFTTCKTFTPNQENFRCANYKSNTGTCSSHFIRQVVLNDFVLDHLQKTTQFVREHEDEFVKAMMDKSQEDQRRELNQQRKELAQAKRRIDELDRLFKRTYEDNASGKLSDERYNKLTADYEAEQQELGAKAKELQALVDKGEEKTISVDKFIVLAKKYTEIRELTPAVLNELISKIEIHAPDKSSGHREQEISIFYNFVGAIPCTLIRRFAPWENDMVYWAKGEIDMRRTLKNPYTAA